MEQRKNYQMHRLSNFFFWLMFWTPMVLVPIFGYAFSNWWFGFGVFFVAFGGLMAREPKSVTFLFFTSMCLAYWLSKGFSLTGGLTFFYLCTLFGFLCGVPAHYYKAKAEEC